MAAITRLSNTSRFSTIPHYFWRSITTTTTTAATTATRPLQTFSRASDLSSRGIQWVFLGCPGVGKGTYASRLSKLLGVPHIATGDLVRHELSSSGPFFDKPTRHFSSSRGFRPGGSNFGSIRSSADWFHLLNKKKEWYLRLKKKKACRLLLKSQFLKKLHSSIQEKDLKDLDAKKKFKYKKGCLGSSFAERNRMKRHFFHSGILNLYIKEKGMNDTNLNQPTQTRHSIASSYKLSDLIYCCASSYQFSMKKREGRSKTKIKKIELPTHISEVNHKTLQAVISYTPSYSELPGYVKRRLGSGAVTTR